ncbi:MAG TPA: hypothetical protein VJ810_23705 [Blastocatellia bacterium]|nr:hypothetical protein [Blastocatellia bacterium]
MTETTETLRQCLQAGVEMLDEDPPAEPRRWQDLLWGCHLAIRSHIEALRAAEEKPIVCAPADNQFDLGF